MDTIELKKPSRDELETMYLALREVLGAPPYSTAQLIKLLMEGNETQVAPGAVVFLIGDFVRNWADAEAKQRSQS